MSNNLDKYKAMGAAAAAAGADQTKTTAGGGERTILPAGPCRLRFVAYIELGKQKKTVMGKAKVQNTVLLGFEVSGPKHPPRVTDAGEKLANMVWLEENLSLNEKARFKKLFTVMNYAGSAQHMVQLLGEAYKGTIVHRPWKSDPTKVEAELYDKVKGTFTIEPPRYEKVNPEEHENPGPTGEYLPLKVDPAISKIKAFLWDHSDLDDWTALFVEGEWPERKDDKGVVTHKAKSKNVVQNKIKLATNFAGSPIYNLLAAAGGNLDIPDAESGHDPDVTSGDDDTDEAAAAVAAQTAIAKAAAAKVPVGKAADDQLNNVV